MGKKSLLTKEDIDILESWADGYFYKIFYYLEDFVKKGIEQKIVYFGRSKGRFKYCFMVCICRQ